MLDIDDHALVAGHRQAFAALERDAVRLLQEGLLEAAAVYAGLAAGYAYHNPCGIFASPALEGLLAEVGRRVLGKGPVVQRPERVGRVLHVLSEAHGIGGHTRSAWRWIGRDAGRVHSIALTRRHDVVPEPLVRATRESGGAFVALWEGDGLFARARRLRELAAAHDVVVLHTNPDDVVPSLAFAGWAGRPPVALVDHADIVFWLGTASLDVLAGGRAIGGELAASHRGIPERRQALVPLPLDDATRARSRAEAKARIGVPPEIRLIVTAASGYKFAPAARETFASLVLPSLAARPDVHLVAVGVDEHDLLFNEARALTGGRVHPIGIRRDAAAFIEAADVYLDSYPFTSATSILEAGSFGTPVLTYEPDDVPRGLLKATDCGIEETLLRATSPARYQELLDGLLDDEPARLAAGARLQADVESSHRGPGWQAHVEALYAHLLAGVERATAPISSESPPWVVTLSRIHTVTGHGLPIDRILQIASDPVPPAAYPEDLALRVGLHELLATAGHAGFALPAAAAAAAPLDATALAGLVAALERLHRAGALAGVTLTVAEETLDAAVALLEPALADVPFEVELAVAPTLGDLLAPGMLVLAPAGSDDASAAAVLGLPALAYAA